MKRPKDHNTNDDTLLHHHDDEHHPAPPRGSILRDIDGHGVCTLTFDDPERGANVLDASVLHELDRHLDFIACDVHAEITALMIRSAKPKIFIAGADLKKLRGKVHCPDQLDALIRHGQRVYDKLADLSIPTVAAIRGACAGGGYELALACDWRVATSDKATRIGLPETQLGILPAWGGSTRLPALVGLPAALAAILSGKLYPAKAAWKKGFVDRLVAPQFIEAEARTLLGQGKRKAPRYRLIHSAPAVAVIRRKARKAAMAKTRGNYPAILRAIDVVCQTVRTSPTESLTAERKAFLDLAEEPATENLLRLFFLTEKAKARTGPADALPIERVAVIGAGVMGAGIAHWLATRGYHVLLKDISPDCLAAGMKRIDGLFRQSVARHALTKVESRAARDRIWTSHTTCPLAGYDLVIEAATENLELKRRIFADLIAETDAHTILATNTSALPLHELTDGLEGGAERIVGLHFFNPVHRMKLVEVVRPDGADEVAVQRVADFARALGKLPVVVADHPGFLVNRILLPYLLEAARMFGEGVPAPVIDEAMLNFGMPMGPLRLLDEVGLDVGIHVAETVIPVVPGCAPISSYLRTMVAEGALGRKAGRGFYLYDGKRKASPRVNPDARSKQRQPAPVFAGNEVADHLSGLLRTEAMRCLREGVSDCADSIDLAMVMGTGYAPFRGGPIASISGIDLPGKKPVSTKIPTS